MNEEGWYYDPYGLHEARWISMGTPTALVRDGAIESNDEPPDSPFTHSLQAVKQHPARDGRDLKRADAAGEMEFDAGAMTQAASDAIDRTTGF